MADITQENLVKEFFLNNPNRDIKHPEVVDWLTVEWKNRKGGVFCDPDRQIRRLAQIGWLQKISKGVYRYDPALVEDRQL
ncbi:MAG: type IV toxin-antitoxin system AbiEi family antitoxin domain-containing protein [Deferribacteraceae bacterium]|jgi:hypothetical protein|nr:type IV toxin-antitoxin system AbiEi family antitoxin domain-containing protein [Deferribacteraceae bacterium]